MKQFFSKAKERWSDFRNNHKVSSKLMMMTAGCAAGIGSAALLVHAAMTPMLYGSGIASFMMGTGGLLLLAGTLTGGSLVPAAIGCYFYERKRNKDLKENPPKNKGRFGKFLENYPWASKLFIASGSIGVGATISTGLLASRMLSTPSTSFEAGLGTALFMAALEVLVLAVSCATALAGAGSYLHERNNNKIKTMVNSKGQMLEGPGGVLKRLEKAEKKAAELAKSFNKSSAHEARVAKVANEIALLSQKVKVVEAAKPAA